MEKTLLPRMSGWLVLVVLLLAAVWLIAPHQLPVSLYKLSLVTLAAVVGYWLDRSLFPHARPHNFLNHAWRANEPESLKNLRTATALVDMH